MSASVGEDKKEPPKIKWYLIILSALLFIGIAALAVAFGVETANFKEYGYLGAFVVSLMATVALIIYVPGMLVIFALCWADKTVEEDGGYSPGVVGAGLHSQYEALELPTSIDSRKIL